MSTHARDRGPAVRRSHAAGAMIASRWRRAVVLGLLVLGPALLAGRASVADDIITDANLVTGLDISDSITQDEMRLGIEGLARAIRSPEFLAAIRSGRHRCIGFAVFAWHHGKFPVVVRWTLIASEADALRVAREMESRMQVNVEVEARKDEPYYVGRLTDLSQAIDHATETLRMAPFASERSVVNIIGNGEDNVGDDAQGARDRSVASGIILNGVVLGSDVSMVDYYRRKVIGGPGAFVMTLSSSASMVEVMTRKLLSDMVADAHLFSADPALAQQ